MGLRGWKAYGCSPGLVGPTSSHSVCQSGVRAATAAKGSNITPHPSQLAAALLRVSPPGLPRLFFKLAIISKIACIQDTEVVVLERALILCVVDRLVG